MRGETIIVFRYCKCITDDFLVITDLYILGIIDGFIFIYGGNLLSVTDLIQLFNFFYRRSENSIPLTSEAQCLYLYLLLAHSILIIRYFNSTFARTEE